MFSVAEFPREQRDENERNGWMGGKKEGRASAALPPPFSPGGLRLWLAEASKALEGCF